MIGAGCDGRSERGFDPKSTACSDSLWGCLKFHVDLHENIKIDGARPGLFKTSKIIKIGQVVFEKSQSAHAPFFSKKYGLEVLLDKSFNKSTLVIVYLAVVFLSRDAAIQQCTFSSYSV